LLGLASVIAATLGGYVLGHSAFVALDGAGVAMLQAFIGGVLLHVLCHGGKAPRLQAAHAAR
jgi:hypothetical protein